MPALPIPARARNAMATRQAILTAAQARFANESYDGASLREIAADAGVDAALVSRYFGSKEDLFIEVLKLAPDPSELFEGSREGFGERVAAMLLDDPQDNDDLICLLIMLRSAASPSASNPLRLTMRNRFRKPFADWLGGPEAEVRAALAGDIIMGVAMSRAMIADHDLDDAGRASMRRRLVAVLQAAIDA